jgi:hypothetical protein
MCIGRHTWYAYTRTFCHPIFCSAEGAISNQTNRVIATAQIYREPLRYVNSRRRIFREQEFCHIAFSSRCRCAADKLLKECLIATDTTRAYSLKDVLNAGGGSNVNPVSCH